MESVSGKQSMVVSAERMAAKKAKGNCKINLRGDHILMEDKKKKKRNIFIIQGPLTCKENTLLESNW